MFRTDSLPECRSTGTSLCQPSPCCHRCPSKCKHQTSLAGCLIGDNNGRLYRMNWWSTESYCQGETTPLWLCYILTKKEENVENMRKIPTRKKGRKHKKIPTSVNDSDLPSLITPSYHRSIPLRWLLSTCERSSHIDLWGPWHKELPPSSGAGASHCGYLVDH